MDPAILNAQESFQHLVNSINSKYTATFLKWVRSTADELLSEVSRTTEDVIMDQIREDLRQTLPTSAIDPSEQIIFPQVGENADCKPVSTVHVDSFLYEENDVDDLCDQGKLSRNYCTKCGSQAVKPCTFLSHSMSCNQLKYLFQFLLPDLRNKTLLDVGSRLGAVLYGGYLYSGASRIIGVEMNAELCNLQQVVVDKYNLADRIQIVCADICKQPDILQNADVVILHNVFEFFLPLEMQRSIWQFLFNTLRKPGSLLVVSPSLESSLQDIQVEFNFHTWVEPVDVTDCMAMANTYLYGSADSEDSELANVHLYKVKPSF